MKILITSPYNQNCIKELEEKFAEVIYKPWKDNGRGFNENELLSMLERYQVNGLITEVDDVSEKVINGYSKLSFIGVCRANPINVDIIAATAKNIPVFNTPARNAQSVAELFIGNVITFLRNVVPSNNWLRKGKWSEEALSAYLDFKGNELAGKTVGFVGFGAVGQTIAKMIRHFPCNIKYYDPFLENVDDEYEGVELQELFKSSDIVSIHLPVTDSTKNMINKDLLMLMKEDAVFVNTARSAVVETNALIDVLSQRKIRGAILDVFDNEPPTERDYELINLPNVLATPHIAGASYEVEDHHSLIMNQNLIGWVEGNKTINIFNQKQLLIKN